MNEIDSVILANGDYPQAEVPLGILANAPYVVCCDGAADEFIAHGNRPDIIIGDGDSLSETNKRLYADILVQVPDQETNDQTKAVGYLMQKGHKRIAILGATGKREDHTMGNIALLVEYMRMGLDVRNYTDHGVFIPCRGVRTFPCRMGQSVSVFNISATGLKSTGLEYPIYDFTALWQGTLNRTASEQFTIEAEGEYIVFICY